MMNLSRRKFLGSCAAAGAVLSVSIGRALAADGFPSKQARLIVPFPPGGATDIAARVIGQAIEDRSGQPVVVENVPGAYARAGMREVIGASPDGHTIVFTSNSGITIDALRPEVGYDLLKDLAPVTNVVGTPFVLVVHPDLPVKSVQEFVAYLKERPGQINLGTNGQASSSHMAGELFMDRTGTRFTMVPFRSNGDLITSQLTNEVQAHFAAISAAKQHIESGKMRALGVSSLQPTPSLPGVPTINKSGVADYEMLLSFGLFTTAGTPPEMIGQIKEELTQTLSEKAVADKMIDMGFDPILNSPDEFSAWLADDIEKWRALVAKANIAL
jgi:tripartite-type tricarboxylate transporter receptor subunit TctC